MDLSGLLEKYRHLVIGVCALCVVLAGYMVYRTFGSSGHRPNANYYTVDDGQTWFADSADRYCPFDYRGKPAVRIHLYRCGSQVVPGYLERLTPAALQTLQKARGDPEAMRRARPMLYMGYQVKRPGDDAWYSPNSPDGIKARAVPCAADTPNPEEVFP